MRSITLLLLVNLVGCDGPLSLDNGHSGIGQAPPADRDGDGVPADVDCDDTDASIPGDEVCDGVDNDCDGEVDEDAVDALSFYADADGDGYGDPSQVVVACEAPLGAVLDSSDCDDGRADVHPGATEVCDADDIDEDCDGLADDADPDVDLDGATGWIRDQDGDGYGAGDPVSFCDDPGDGWVQDATDCDDSADNVNPGAVEVCDDELDNDCDGSVDPRSQCVNLSLATVPTLYGASAEDYAGFSIAGVGDVDGDGWSDVLVGAPGEDLGGTSAGGAWLVTGPITGDMSLDEADAHLVGVSKQDYAGLAVTGGADADGDGLNDLAVGAPFEETGGAQAGAVYFMNGPVTGQVSLEDADATFFGAAADDQVGSVVLLSQDLNQDGLADLVVGSALHDGGGTNDGAVYMIFGPVSGSRQLSSADLIISGDGAGARAGSAVVSPGDLDGDGVADLVVGAPQEDTRAGNAGSVYVFSGPFTEQLELDDATAHLCGEASLDHAGATLAAPGDVNGDGVADLVIGAPQEHAVYTEAGAAYVMYGPLSGDIDLGAADAKYRGQAAFDLAGSALAGPGDMNGDGFADFVVGAAWHDGGGTDAGVAYVVFGPVSGGWTLTQADRKLLGESSGDLAGNALAGAGDMDGDALPDLLVGARHESSRTTEAGAAYVYSSTTP